MQQPLLKLSQASELTGRHEDTIRRLIKNLLKTDPQAQEKIKQEQTVRGFHYLIDEEYLLKHLQPLQKPSQSKDSATSKTASNQPYRQPLNKGMQQPLQQGLHQPTYAELKAKDETISILKKQLEQKDEQIRQFLDRTRETNILLKGYQDRYLIEAPGEKKEGETEKEKVRDNPVSAKPKPKLFQKTSKQPKKTTRGQPEQPKKKGFFSFLRGK
jgi:hypothetical protein